MARNNKQYKLIFSLKPLVLFSYFRRQLSRLARRKINGDLNRDFNNSVIPDLTQEKSLDIKSRVSVYLIDDRRMG